MKDIKHSTTATDEEKENGVMDDSGGIYSPDGKRLLEISLLDRNSKSSYTVKDGTEIICDDAFISCKSLESIVLPKSLTSIGYEAFFGCISLRRIYIPESVTSIGDGASADCKSLQTIDIPDSVISLGCGLFIGDISY